MKTTMKRKMTILAAALSPLVAGMGKEAMAGTPPPLDHYKCYNVSGENVQGSALLADQFSEVNARVLKPVLLCNPVSKDGGGIINPVDHLVCYNIIPKDKPDENQDEPTVHNQFGANQRLQVKQAQLLCVPSLKDPE